MRKRIGRILDEMIMGEARFRPPFLSYPAAADEGKTAEKSDTAVLLAVSGGMDSMCLADLFLHSGTGIRFEIAHCNFHLRGEDSDSDENLVRSWGRNNGIEVHVADFDTLTYAREHGSSIEMAARELRYRWFGKLCRENGFRAAVVAHHADDNAETLFLNILRGTGLRGICGMSAVSSLPCQESDAEGGAPVLLLRPMLEFTRDQIEGYVRRYGIEYHTDRTNADIKYRRNLIRNEVFPLLERLNPSFVKTVSREMKYFSQANEIAESAVSDETPFCIVRSSGIGEETVIDIAGLLSSSYWEYRLYRILERYGFNSSAVESVEHFLKSAGGKGFTIAGKRFFSSSYMLVTTSSNLIIRNIAQNENCCAAVNGAGEYAAGNTVFSVRIAGRSEILSLKPPAGTIYLDADSLHFPFVCRGWRKGDWIRPLGMKNGKKKVSDLFADLKYDLFRKEAALLIESGEGGGHVLALLGERIDESVRITGATKSVMVIRLK